MAVKVHSAPASDGGLDFVAKCKAYREQRSSAKEKRLHGVITTGIAIICIGLFGQVFSALALENNVYLNSSLIAMTGLGFCTLTACPTSEVDVNRTLNRRRCMRLCVCTTFALIVVNIGKLGIPCAILALWLALNERSSESLTAAPESIIGDLCRYPDSTTIMSFAMIATFPASYYGEGRWLKNLVVVLLTLLMGLWWLYARTLFRRSGGVRGTDPSLRFYYITFAQFACHAVVNACFLARSDSEGSDALLKGAAHALSPCLVLAIGRDRLFNLVAKHFENEQAKADGAMMAELLASRREILPGMPRWVHRQLPDLSFARFDHRRNWQQGVITQVAETSITVELPGGEVHHAPFVASRVGADQLLESAMRNLRGISWSSFSEELMASSNSLPHMEDLAFPTRGAAPDFFLSHSWHDDPVAKYEALQQVAGEFGADHGREPIFWLDKVCIDQNQIDEGLKTLPVNVMSCNKLLVICGETYLSRLWCVMELCTLLSFMHESEAVARIDFRLLPGSHRSEEEIFDILLSYDVAQARCYDPNEQAHLFHIISSLGFEHMNSKMRRLGEAMKRRRAETGFAPTWWSLEAALGSDDAIIKCKAYQEQRLKAKKKRLNAVNRTGVIVAIIGMFLTVVSLSVIPDSLFAGVVSNMVASSGWCIVASCPTSQLDLNTLFKNERWSRLAVATLVALLAVGVAGFWATACVIFCVWLACNEHINGNLKAIQRRTINYLCRYPDSTTLLSCACILLFPCCWEPTMQDVSRWDSADDNARVLALMKLVLTLTMVLLWLYLQLSFQRSGGERGADPTLRFFYVFFVFCWSSTLMAVAASLLIDTLGMSWMGGTALGLSPLLLVAFGRDRFFNFVASGFESRQANTDGALVAELLCSGIEVLPGVKRWVHRQQPDLNFEPFDHRRNWQKGVVVRVTETSFDVELPGGGVHETPVAANALQAGKLLEVARQHLRGIRWSNFSEELMSNRHTGTEMGVLDKRTCGLAPDFFVSHSWHDDAEVKYDTLQQVVDEFRADCSRDPVFWLDRVCFHEQRAFEGLMALPVHVMSCKKVLVLCGRTYFCRLRCIMELCMLLSFMHESEAAARIDFRLLHDYHGSEEEVLDSLLVFDVAQARCCDPNEQEHLFKIIHVMGFEHINAKMRRLGKAMKQRRYGESLLRKAARSLEGV